MDDIKATTVSKKLNGLGGEPTWCHSNFQKHVKRFHENFISHARSKRNPKNFNDCADEIPGDICIIIQQTSDPVEGTIMKPSPALLSSEMQCNGSIKRPFGEADLVIFYFLPILRTFSMIILLLQESNFDLQFAADVFNEITLHTSTSTTGAFNDTTYDASTIYIYEYTHT